MGLRPRSLFPTANSQISKKIPPRYQCYTFCFIIMMILIICLSSMDMASGSAFSNPSPPKLIRLQKVGPVSV